MTIRKSKKIRQLAPGRGKMTNTEGQVGEVQIMCLLSRKIISSNGGRFIVAGAGLRLGRTRPEHVQVATVAELALAVAVAEMALVTAVAELALAVAVAEMALVTAVDELALAVAVAEMALVAAVAEMTLVAAVAEMALVA